MLTSSPEVLPSELERTLRDMNPWWAGEPQAPLPRFRRWLFDSLFQKLQKGLAPCVALRGPRQVGKSTLLRQMIQALLEHGVAAERILHVSFDKLPSFRSLSEPALQIARWFRENILRQNFNAPAQSGPVFLFFDEVQNLRDWAPQIKFLVDHHAVRVMITGSSALRIELGQDSLAGRLTMAELGPLLLREIGILRLAEEMEAFLPPNGWDALRKKETWLELRNFGERYKTFRHKAFEAFSERGGYPLGHVHADAAWEDVAEQLFQNVVIRVIQHDLRVSERGQRRNEGLLREVFRLACVYAGQAPSQALYIAEIQRVFSQNISWTKVLSYLRHLESSLLLRLVEPLELRLKKKRGADKICLCDHALRAAWLSEVVPLHPKALRQVPDLTGLAGHLAESVVGQFFKSLLGLGVNHFPTRSDEPEVDFVLTIGEQRIPVEVKYRRRIDFEDTLGLRSFLEKSHYHAPFGLLITLEDAPGSDDPRIVSLPLSSLLLLR